ARAHDPRAARSLPGPTKVRAGLRARANIRKNKTINRFTHGHVWAIWGLRPVGRERLVGRESGAGDGGQASRAERNLRAQLGLLAELPAEVPPNHRATLDQNDDDDDADYAAGFCAG